MHMCARTYTHTQIIAKIPIFTSGLCLSYLLWPGSKSYGLSGYSVLLLLLLSRFSHVWLSATPQTAAHQAPRPWDSPGKNTAVGCHFLLQCMKVKMDCSLPGSSVHGIFQARVLESGAIAFSAWISKSWLVWVHPPLSLKSYLLK